MRNAKPNDLKFDFTSFVFFSVFCCCSSSLSSSRFLFHLRDASFWCLIIKRTDSNSVVIRDWERERGEKIVNSCSVFSGRISNSEKKILSILKVDSNFIPNGKKRRKKAEKCSSIQQMVHIKSAFYFAFLWLDEHNWSDRNIEKRGKKKVKILFTFRFTESNINWANIGIWCKIKSQLRNFFFFVIFSFAFLFYISSKEINPVYQMIENVFRIFIEYFFISSSSNVKK